MKQSEETGRARILFDFRWKEVGGKLSANNLLPIPEYSDLDAVQPVAERLTTRSPNRSLLSLERLRDKLRSLPRWFVFNRSPFHFDVPYYPSLEISLGFH